MPTAVGIMAESYKAPVSGFSPLSIPWRSAFWASDPSWTPPADGAGVSSWRNAGTRATNAVQATGGQQPIYRSSVAVLNGKPALEFDGVNHNLVEPVDTLAVPYSGVVIFVATNTTGEKRLYGRTGGGGNGLIIGTNGTALRMYAGAFATSTVVLTASTAFLVIGVNLAGAADRLVVNGTTTSGLTAADGAHSGITFGWDGGSAKFAGHIAFGATYSGDLTAQQVTDLNGWAKTFYGAPIP